MKWAPDNRHGRIESTRHLMYMGCVRDPGSEGLAAVGKLLCEVDRCREPSKMLSSSRPSLLLIFSLTPSRLHPV